ncbi:hypothetical protein D3C71_2096770 [compost metagenome]
MARHVHGLHIQPQVQAFAGGGVEKIFKQRLAQVFQVHPLRRLRIQAARIGTRQRQQLVRQLRGAARGVAQLLNLINS